MRGDPPIPMPMRHRGHGGAWKPSFLGAQNRGEEGDQVDFDIPRNTPRPSRKISTTRDQTPPPPTTRWASGPRRWMIHLILCETRSSSSKSEPTKSGIFAAVTWNLCNLRSVLSHVCGDVEACCHMCGDLAAGHAPSPQPPLGAEARDPTGPSRAPPTDPSSPPQSDNHIRASRQPTKKCISRRKLSKSICKRRGANALPGGCMDCGVERRMRLARRNTSEQASKNTSGQASEQTIKQYQPRARERLSPIKYIPHTCVVGAQSGLVLTSTKALEPLHAYTGTRGAHHSAKPKSPQYLAPSPPHCFPDRHGTPRATHRADNPSAWQ